MSHEHYRYGSDYETSKRKPTNGFDYDRVHAARSPEYSYGEAATIPPFVKFGVRFLVVINLILMWLGYSVLWLTMGFMEGFPAFLFLAGIIVLGAVNSMVSLKLLNIAFKFPEGLD